jgi:hypothetical protein
VVQKGPLFGPNMAQKVVILDPFLDHIWALFEPFWEAFRALLAHLTEAHCSIGHIALREVLRRPPNMAQIWPKKWSFWTPFWTIFGPFLSPSGRPLEHYWPI